MPSSRHWRRARTTSARVWEISDRREVARISHEGSVTAITFSPDGNYLITCAESGLEQQWRWRHQHLIEEACSRLTRNLTPEEWHQYLGDEPYQRTCTHLP